MNSAEYISLSSDDDPLAAFIHRRVTAAQVQQAMVCFRDDLNEIVSMFTVSIKLGHL